MGLLGLATPRQAFLVSLQRFAIPGKEPSLPNNELVPEFTFTPKSFQAIKVSKPKAPDHTNRGDPILITRLHL
jgi:hypothetical protein